MTTPDPLARLDALIEAANGAGRGRHRRRLHRALPLLLAEVREARRLVDALGDMISDEPTPAEGGSGITCFASYLSARAATDGALGSGA